MFGLPLQDFVVLIVMGIPASVGMLYAAVTVEPEEQDPEPVAADVAAAIDAFTADLDRLAIQDLGGPAVVASIVPGTSRKV